MSKNANNHTEDYQRAVRMAMLAGDTLPGEGGVDAETVAERLDVSYSRASTKLRRLSDEGRLERVIGIEDGPRTGYLPVGHRHAGSATRGFEVGSDD
jgi:hypothetical protein